MLLKRSFVSSSPNLGTIIFRFCHVHTQISTPTKNPLLFNYLTNILSLPEPKALIISNRYSNIKTLEKPQNIVNYFQSLGFSDTQIQSLVFLSPQILFAHVEKTLKPKVTFFQDLGISEVKLCKFISKNPSLLHYSLNKRVKLCLDAINKILVFRNGEESDDLCRVLSRCSWLLASSNPAKRFLANILYLNSCGIYGSQLAMILIRQPRIFGFSESEIKNRVAKVVNMGISVDSRMFVYGLMSVSCISKETFDKKFGIFKEFGFSEIECMHMFKTTPNLLMTSENKLRVGFEFFIKTVGAKRSMIVNLPISLMLSMQDRVIPRYRVVQLLKEKRIMKKELKSLSLFSLSEKRFLMSYILRYSDHSEELLITYKGRS